MEASWLHHAFVAVLVVGLPIYDHFDTRRLKASSDPRAKVTSYQRVILFLTLSSLFLVFTLPAGAIFTPASWDAFTGWRAGLGIPSWVAVGVLLAALLLPAVYMLLAWRNPEVRDKLVGTLEGMRFFLPVTPAQRRWFAVLSIAAGVGEEIIYRGFLIAWFESLPFDWGLPVSVILAAVVFSIAHGYQGIGGMLTTGGIAVLLTGLYYFSGSLLVPMLVHALGDLRLLLTRLPEDAPMAKAE